MIEPLLQHPQLVEFVVKGKHVLWESFEILSEKVCDDCTYLCIALKFINFLLLLKDGHLYASTVAILGTCFEFLYQYSHNCDK